MTIKVLTISGCLLLLSTNRLLAQTVAPSTFTSSIQVQGEPEGTEFDDWANIPIAFSDPSDNPGDSEGRPFIDLANIQVANDNNFLYIHASFHNTSSVGTLIGIDLDRDIATGFDIFDLGLIGSEVGYINDFPFQQATGVFNINVALTGGPLTNGGALIYPFWDQDGADKEWAIPLDLMLGFPAGEDAFANTTIDFMVYTDEGAGDIVDESISYTLATNPSPGTAGDFDGSLAVGNGDLTLLLDGWGGAPGPEWVRDVPVSVGNESLTILLDNWGNDYSNGILAAVASVPEPASLSLLAAALGLATWCRRLDG